MQKLEKQKVVIIILNYKNYETTIFCVNQLLNCKVKHRILIVDNHSENESYEILSKYFKDKENVSVCECEYNGGYSAGNNYGIHYAERLADFQYVCVMNPDVVIDKDYFDELCDLLEAKNNYAVISPLMVYSEEIDLNNIAIKIRTAKEVYRKHLLLHRLCKKSTNHKLNYIGNGLIETDAVPGSCFIIDKAILEKIDGFDEKVFLYNEENILGIKLKNVGKKCLISLTHQFIHNHDYEGEKKLVWYKYKYEFDDVMKNYYITYESRKYMCEAYYNGKYLYRLKIVNRVNIILLYIKRIYAWIVYLKKSK